jgi:hypothetical protein
MLDNFTKLGVSFESEIYTLKIIFKPHAVGTRGRQMPQEMGLSTALVMSNVASIDATTTKLLRMSFSGRDML